MGKKSYDNGKKFEKDLCNYLSNKNYYIIYNEKGITGAQPCDVVAIKGDIATLFECKNLENESGIFNLDRIEENQRMAYNRYRECDNNNFVLAILWNDNVWFIDFGIIQFFNKSIDLKDIEPNIINFSKEIENL